MSGPYVSSGSRPASPAEPAAAAMSPAYSLTHHHSPCRSSPSNSARARPGSSHLSNWKINNVSEYNILFSSDSNYLRYTLVAAQSIVDSLERSSAQPDKNDDLIVFNIIVDESVDTGDLSIKCQNFARRNQLPGVSFKFNVLSVDRKLFEGCVPFREDGNYSTYYRLLLDKVLPSTVDSVLYMDVDILVLEDIRKLFNSTDWSQTVLGAVVNYPQCVRDEQYSVKSTDSSLPALTMHSKNYFNAGILLINLQQWRENHISDRAVELARTYSFPFHDQDILNVIFKDKVTLMDPSWNMQTGLYYESMNRTVKNRKWKDLSTMFSSMGTFDQWDPEVFMSHPDIIHFTHIKPWTHRLPSDNKSTDTSDILSPHQYYYMSLWRNTAARVSEYSMELMPAIADSSCDNAYVIAQIQHELLIYKRKLRKSVRLFTLITSGLVVLTLGTIIVSIVL